MAAVCVCACGNKCDQHLDSTKIVSKYFPLEVYHHKILIVPDTSFHVEWAAEHAIKSDQNQYTRLSISAQISWQLDEFGASSSARSVSRSLSQSESDPGQMWARKISANLLISPPLFEFQWDIFLFSRQLLNMKSRYHSEHVLGLFVHVCPALALFYLTAHFLPAGWPAARALGHHFLFCGARESVNLMKGTMTGTASAATGLTTCTYFSKSKRKWTITTSHSVRDEIGIVLAQ